MPFVRVPTLTAANPIVDGHGRPTPAFLRSFNEAVANLAEAINAIAELPEIKASLDNLDEATRAATIAAERAENAAQNAGGQAENAARESELNNSGVEPRSNLVARNNTILIRDHVRRYGNGVAVPVVGGSIGGIAEGAISYVYYDDPARAGGNVTYQASTVQPIQAGNRHVVGAVTMPYGTVTNEGGLGPTIPGYVEP